MLAKQDRIGWGQSLLPGEDGLLVRQPGLVGAGKCSIVWLAGLAQRGLRGGGDFVSGLR